MYSVHVLQTELLHMYCTVLYRTVPYRTVPYLGQSDAGHPGHKVMSAGNTDMNDPLLVLGEGSMWLQQEGRRGGREGGREGGRSIHTVQ